MPLVAAQSSEESGKQFCFKPQTCRREVGEMEVSSTETVGVQVLLKNVIFVEVEQILWERWALGL